MSYFYRPGDYDAGDDQIAARIEEYIPGLTYTIKRIEGEAQIEIDDDPAFTEEQLELVDEALSTYGYTRRNI